MKLDICMLISCVEAAASRGLTGCDWVNDYDDILVLGFAAAANDIHYTAAVKPKVATVVKELAAALSHNRHNEST